MSDGALAQRVDRVESRLDGHDKRLGKLEQATAVGDVRMDAMEENIVRAAAADRAATAVQGLIRWIAGAAVAFGLNLLYMLLRKVVES